MYACTYACMYVCTYVYIYECMSFLCVRLCVCMYACMLMLQRHGAGMGHDLLSLPSPNFQLPCHTSFSFYRLTFRCSCGVCAWLRLVSTNSKNIASTGSSIASNCCLFAFCVLQIRTCPPTAAAQAIYTVLCRPLVSFLKVLFGAINLEIWRVRACRMWHLGSCELGVFRF